MDLKFRTFVGEAGDFHEMLIGETPHCRHYTLFTRAYFKNFNLWRARRRLEKEHRILCRGLVTKDDLREAADLIKQMNDNLNAALEALRRRKK